MNKALIVLLAIISVMLIISTSCMEKEPGRGSAIFSIIPQTEELLQYKDSVVLPQPYEIQFTVSDADGLSFMQNVKMVLIEDGSNYKTSLVELDEGTYKIESLAVIDYERNTVYFAPEIGSEYETSATIILPFEFDILPDRNIIVDIDVILSDTVIINPNVNLDEDLILYLPFNGSTVDQSPRSNNAIDFSSGTYVEGVLGQALNFNGYSDYLTLTNSISNIDKLSFSFWVKSAGPTESDNLGVLFSKYAYQDRSLWISTYGYGDNKARNRIIVHYFSSATGGSSDHTESDLSLEYIVEKNLDQTKYELINPQPLPVSEWTHVVINQTPEYLECYLNGTLTTRKMRVFNSYTVSDLQPCYIGNMFNGADGDNNHLHGSLDEFRIYNRPITPDEIQVLFEAEYLDND